MKKNIILVAAALLVFASNPVWAGNNDMASRSNIGLKLALGLGNSKPSNSQSLQEGGAVALNLGYGVSQNITLWLGGQISGHEHSEIQNLEEGILGLEFSLQYKLRPYEKLRPYGKLGLGGFLRGSDETDVTLSGGGVSWALGAEYRLARFLTVGAELFWKDYDYTQQKIGDSDFAELDNPIHGNTNGFLLTFTLH